MDNLPVDQAIASSSLLPLARAIDESMDQCRALYSQGRLQDDNPLSDKLMSLRDKLASSKPETAIDALVIVANMQAIAEALARSDIEELGPAAVHLGVREMLHALMGLKGFLEREGGVTAESLGLNPDGTSWQ